MRCLPANLLLGLFLWIYAAPGFFAVTQLDLPPCCRHGMHHACHCGCARRMARCGDNSPGYHQKSTPCHCPMLGSILHVTTAAEARRSGFSAPSESQLRLPEQGANRGWRIPIRRAGRAPPLTAS
jgi:hypothetical protein